MEDERFYQVFVAGREFCGLIDGGTEKPFVTLKQAAMVRRLQVDKSRIRVEAMPLSRDPEYSTGDMTFSTSGALFFELKPGSQTHELWKQSVSVIQTARPAVVGLDGKPIG